MLPDNFSITFLAPLFLLAGAAALLARLLHRRAQRRPVRVPSLLLWRQLQAVRGEVRARQAWPSPNLPMILQIAAIVLLALALARPLVGRTPALPLHKIYVLDAGAAMQATDAGRTRFERARAQVAERIRADVDPDGPRVSLILAGPIPEPVLARQRVDHDVVAPIADSLRPADGPVDWRATARLVESLRRDGETVDVYVYGDADALAFASLAPGVSVTLAPSGDAGADASLEAMLTPVGEGADKFLLTGAIVFRGGLEQTTLTVDFRSATAATPLRLAAKTFAAPKSGADAAGSLPFSLEIPATGAGLVSVHLSDDRNASNNGAFFVIDAKPSRPSILLVGRARPALAQALGSLAGVNLQQKDALPADVSGFRLVVLADAVVDHAPQTSTLWIGQSRVAGAEAPPTLEPGDITGWREDHALSRGIFWSGFALSRASKFAPWPDGEVILSAGDTPLIEARSGPHGREVRIAFDPSREWTAQTSFPQFLDNLVDWLGAVEGSRIRASCTVGVVCPIDARWFGGALAPVAGMTQAGVAERIALPGSGGAFIPLHAGVFRHESDSESALLAINPAPVAPVLATAPSLAASARGAVVKLWAWLLGAAVLVLVAEAFVARRRRNGPRWLPLSRTLVLAALVAACFNLPAPVVTVPDRNVLIVAAPVSDGEAISAATANADHRATIVVGDGVRVAGDFGEAAPAPRVAAAADAATVDAVRIAAAMLAPGQGGHIALQGRVELAGRDVAALAPSLAARGIVVDVAPGNAMPASDLAVVDVEAPQNVFAGESFTLSGRIRAAQATKAHLDIRADGEAIATRDIDLTPGDNPVEITIPRAREGDAFYEMTVSSPADVIAQNNANGLFVKGRAPPRVMVLGVGAAARDMAEMLAAHGLATKAMVPTGAPWLIEDWLAFDAYMFLDVPAIALNSTQQALLEEAVSRHGRALVFFGGSHSFGPGGYLETALDRLSPLSSRVPKPSPEAGVVFVIDRSGSMAQAVGDTDRLQLARQATLSAISLLNPKSSVSVIAFDTEARVVAPLQPVTRVGNIRAALQQMTPGGGTDLYPALKMAFDQLRNAESSVKHVIVFTDGLIPPAPYDPLVSEMAGAGITVSTVSIGTGGGDNVLRNISKLGGGAFHATNDFRALPSILSQETMLLSDSAVEERRTTPQWTGARPKFLTALPRTLPDINGYVLTSSKPDALVSLKIATADGGDAPLLASWQYGAGKVLAMTTQANGPWIRNWLAMPEYLPLWSEALPQFLSGADAVGLTLRAARDDRGIAIRATALDKQRKPRGQIVLEASVKSLARGEAPPAVTVRLNETQAGVYEAVAPFSAPGDYAIEVRDGEILSSLKFHIAYAQRLAFDPARSQAEKLAAATGGRVVSEANLDLPSVHLEVSIRPNGIVWALVALLAFIVELLVRYGAGLTLGLREALAALTMRRRMTPLPSKA